MTPGEQDAGAPPPPWSSLEGPPPEVPLGVHHTVAPTADELALLTTSPNPRPAPGPPQAPAPSGVVEHTALDWDTIRAAVDPAAVRARMQDTVTRLDAMLDNAEGPGLLFDDAREDAEDRAIHIRSLDERAPLWFIGDLHGDLLALEAALAVIRTAGPSRIVFLGDLIDDGGFGLETLLRVMELMVEHPESITMVAGNHDEALGFDGTRFTATVLPSDFSDLLNTRLDDEWTTRTGAAAVRLFRWLPRALFFPDGLLVAHGGFPLVDQHEALRASGNWNDPRCLTDFVWTRAHPKSRRKMPNRSSRGSQFGYEDFADFCALAAELGRPVTGMVRGHDHVDDRWALYPAYAAHPVLTTVALSRQLAREPFGPYERVPTFARWVPGATPEVHRLHVPPELVRELYPPPQGDEGGVA